MYRARIYLMVFAALTLMLAGAMPAAAQAGAIGDLLKGAAGGAASDALKGAAGGVLKGAAGGALKGVASGVAGDLIKGAVGGVAGDLIKGAVGGVASELLGGAGASPTVTVTAEQPVMIIHGDSLFIAYRGTITKLDIATLTKQAEATYPTVPPGT